MISEFVSPVGLHHVSAFHSVEADGQLVIIISAVSFDGAIYFYQVDSEKKALKKLQLLEKNESKYSYWACRWFVSDDSAIENRFVATTVQGVTKVWRFNAFKEREVDENGRPVGPLVYEPHMRLQGNIESQVPRFATSVDISANGLIATGFSDGSVVVSQLSTLRPVYNFEGFGLQGVEESSTTVRAVEFSPAGTLLAVANDSGSYGCVSLYETEFGERIGNFTVPTHGSQASIASYAHNGWVFDLSFSNSGEYLASCGYDAKVRVWDTKTRERVSTLNINASDIEIEDDIVAEDVQGDSLQTPPVLAVSFIDKGVRAGMGSSTNEGICCTCSDRSVRWYREAGGI